MKGDRRENKELREGGGRKNVRGDGREEGKEGRKKYNLKAF